MPQTLKLVISKQPFEVMKTGEKLEEFRRISKWMQSRLYNKDGTEKHYDKIQFIHGYGPTRPFFIATYEGHTIEDNISRSYSTGFNINIENTPTYVLHFSFA
jgi:hypothetical protein